MSLSSLDDARDIIGRWLTDSALRSAMKPALTAALAAHRDDALARIVGDSIDYRHASLASRRDVSI